MERRYEANSRRKTTHHKRKGDKVGEIYGGKKSLCPGGKKKGVKVGSIRPHRKKRLETAALLCGKAPQNGKILSSVASRTIRKESFKEKWMGAPLRVDSHKSHGRSLLVAACREGRWEQFSR